jgi:hypothetical protein
MSKQTWREAGPSMTLDKFFSKLTVKMQPNLNWRPLVCDGSPLTCRVFVVGYNPATSFTTPFANHWSSDWGFIREKFLEDFRHQRNQHDKLRGTRARLEIIADQFKNNFGRNSILEANIFSKPTARAKELATGDKTIFKFLMETVRPIIVLVHGRKTFHHFKRLCTSNVDRAKIFQEICWKDQRLRFLWSPHLSLVSHERAKELGNILADELKGLAQ